jgi:hypothetical protein
LIIAGCGAKARVDIYMEPVGGDEYTVDARTGAITLEKNDVNIKVKPLDAVDLLDLTEDEDINPYIDVNFWGYVIPLYTVFDVTIQNKRDSKVVVDPISFLIDENGDQYASLPYDYFKDVYGARYREYAEVVYHPHRWPYFYRGYYPHRWHHPYYPYRYYYRPYYVSRVSNEDAQYCKMVARETIFDGAKLFSGAKRSGLLVFERLDEGATDVKLIIPEATIYDGEKRHKLNFEFYFQQKVSVKE